jgi:hypothetical protein
MYYHKIPSAIVFMFMFLSWEILFSIFAWRSFVSWWQNRVPTHITDPLRVPIPENVDDNHKDDRTPGQLAIESEVTESESEYESVINFFFFCNNKVYYKYYYWLMYIFNLKSRPGSIISPTDTALVSESGETSYGTESHLTDDNESQSFISKSLDDYDSSSVAETDDDIVDDDDDQTEGSATPTKSPARSRKSTVSEVSTNKSDVEDEPSTSASTASSTARLQNNSTKPYARRSNSSGGNNIE